MSTIPFVIAIQTTGVRSMRCYLKASLVSILSCALLLSTIARANQAEGKRGLTPEDYFAFEFISDPRMSPDGKLVAYVITTVDQKQNRRNSSIWMAAIDGSR